MTNDSLYDTYMIRFNHDKVAAAKDMALDLMRDHPDKFISGYSLDNALLAARDYFVLNSDEEGKLKARFTPNL